MTSSRLAEDVLRMAGFVDGINYLRWLQTADSVDCVLVFIPNESIYGFLHEHDRDLIDVALSKKVILCSPTSLRLSTSCETPMVGQKEEWMRRRRPSR